MGGVEDLQVRPEAGLEHFAAVLGAAEQELLSVRCALHSERRIEEAEDSDLEARLMIYERVPGCVEGLAPLGSQLVGLALCCAHLAGDAADCPIDLSSRRKGASMCSDVQI